MPSAEVSALLGLSCDLPNPISLGSQQNKLNHSRSVTLLVELQVELLKCAPAPEM